MVGVRNSSPSPGLVQLFRIRISVFLLLADLLLFHRKLALLRWPRLLAVFAVISVGFLPLLRRALANIAHSPVPVAIHAGLSQDIAAFGYAAFGIFASVAVVPWYWPLSIPVALAIAAIVVAMWPSPGRRWFIYFALTMVVLELSAR